MPYIKVNSEERVQTAEITVNEGDTVLIQPESAVTGIWTWTGVNNFTSSQKDITFNNIKVNKAGTYLVKFAANGVIYSQTFSVNVVKKVFESVNKMQSAIIISKSAIPDFTGQIHRFRLRRIRAENRN